MTYKPNAGSMPAKLIDFLNINGDEELTIEDIAAKFGVSALSVHSCLATALTGGAVARLKNEDGEYIYVHASRSPAQAAKPVWPHAATGHTPTASSPFGNLGKPKSKPSANASGLPVDLAALELDDDIPLKAVNPQLDWPGLFGRMQPGQSCVLPRSVGMSCAKAITAYKASGLGELQRKTVNEDQFRLWRIA